MLQGIDSLVGNAIRPMLISTTDLSGMDIIDLWNAAQAPRAAGQPTGAPFFRQLAAGERTGNVGRNTLRADGIANLDFGLQKNTRIVEGHNLQFRAEFYNLTNTRNFGTPNSLISSGANFLNQWAPNGGARRVVMGLRYTF